MMPIVLASLLLVPVLEEPTPIRAVTLGAESMAWSLDGAPFDPEGGVVLEAGRHEVWVHGPDDEPWVALLRPAPAEPGALVHVDAWVARHEPASTPGGPVASSPPWAWAIGAVMAGLAALLSTKRP